jgi:hypothetical protein
MVIENIVPATVMLEVAMADNIERAPSMPPE